MLPPIGPSCEVVGGISAKTAALTGLLEGTPVVRGVVDVTAAALSSGLTRPDEMSVVAGTFSINSTLHATPRQSLAPFLQTPYPLGGYLATEGAATSASNLEWMVKTLLSHGGALPLEQAASIYDVINTAVQRKLGKPREALFFPFLFGGPDGAPAGLLGMTADYSFDDIMHAVFEGIVFAHKVDIDRLLSGNDAARPQVIRLAGGASRSELWSEMFADILGLPVEVPNRLGTRRAGGGDLCRHRHRRACLAGGCNHCHDRHRASPPRQRPPRQTLPGEIPPLSRPQRSPRCCLVQTPHHRRAVCLNFRASPAWSKAKAGFTPPPLRLNAAR